MFTFTLLALISSFNLTGFWHSQPDLSEGYESCYFFWHTGEYAFLESIEEGTVYLGNWFLRGNELVLDLSDGITVSGIAANVRLSEITLDFSVTGNKNRHISLDGESFFLLERNPQSAILSLVPTWGMTDSERDVFSTYD